MVHPKRKDFTMSYHQILYHIVLNTYKQQHVLPLQHDEALYKYIWGIVKGHKSILFQINGTMNHIHLLTALHPTVCLADFIKDIKVASNLWMHNSGLFPDFDSWSVGYGAFTKSKSDKQMIMNYIKRQKEHHKVRTFEDEYRDLLRKNGVGWDERYLF